MPFVYMVSLTLISILNCVCVFRFGRHKNQSQ